jgi:hypothetical protein
VFFRNNGFSGHVRCAAGRSATDTYLSSFPPDFGLLILYRVAKLVKCQHDESLDSQSPGIPEAGALMTG